MSAGKGGRFLGRGDPLFAFTPAAWAGDPVRCKEEVPAEDIARAVVSATYFAGLGQPGIRDRMMALARIHVAATLVALHADQVCPGGRPAGAGDLLSAAAYRADGALVSVPRSQTWGNGVHEAVMRALATRDAEIATLVITDVMLLVLEVLA